MKRILLSAAILLAVGAFVVIAGGASNNDSAAGTYKIELDNAFGLVTGADFKVAGVRAGTIQSIELPKNCINGGGNPTCHALVTVQVTQSGFGSFQSDAFCQSRPQSLIGEYFIDCQPGQYGKALKPGSTIPVSHTESTIPADLVQNVMRLPYRRALHADHQRARRRRRRPVGRPAGGAAPGRPGADRDRQPAEPAGQRLAHAPAADGGLELGDHRAGQQLQAGQAVHRRGRQHRARHRHPAARTCACRSSACRGFLEQLRPAMAKLGAAADANEPVLANLNAAASNFNRLLRDLPAFSQLRAAGDQVARARPR